MELSTLCVRTGRSRSIIEIGVIQCIRSRSLRAIRTEASPIGGGISLIEWAAQHIRGGRILYGIRDRASPGGVRQCIGRLRRRYRRWTGVSSRADAGAGCNRHCGGRAHDLRLSVSLDGDCESETKNRN